MRSFAKFLELLWTCTFCGYVNRVSLRERSAGDFPQKEDYEWYKPFACYRCGSHEYFEFRESREIERVIRANGSD